MHFDLILTFFGLNFSLSSALLFESAAPIKVITNQNEKIDGFDTLADLALNLRWSWNHATDEVWRQLDPKLWELTSNPWVVLQSASNEKIKHVLTDPVFRKQVNELAEARRKSLESPAWFQQKHQNTSLIVSPTSAWSLC